MKRQIKNLIIVAASLATLASSVTPAAACGGRGGGYGGGYARPSAYRRPVNYAPSYSSYNQPVYNQPRVYNQPQYGFNQSASVINQGQRVQRFTQPAQSSVPTQASFQQQAVQRPVQRTVQQPVRQASAQQPTVQQRATNRQVTSSPNRLASAAKSAATQAPAANSAVSAETSALKMLQSLGTPKAQPTASAASSSIPQFTAAPAANDQAHVGTWRVSLPNSQSVQLQLQANGDFVWTAVSKGSQRSFNGQYRMTDGRLTLVRSNDLQQMTGSWTGGNNQFTFKLNGAKNGGLSFKRS